MLQDIINNISTKTGTKFHTTKPHMPKQKQGSNNCGLHAIHYAKLIMDKPEEFEQEAVKNNLENWMDMSSVQGMRSSLANLFFTLGQYQRKPGKELFGVRITWPKFRTIKINKV
jgi:hypothetical protein